MLALFSMAAGAAETKIAMSDLPAVEEGKSFYEASIRKGGKSAEVQVDKDGDKVR